MLRVRDCRLFVASLSVLVCLGFSVYAKSETSVEFPVSCGIETGPQTRDRRNPSSYCGTRTRSRTRPMSFDYHYSGYRVMTMQYFFDGIAMLSLTGVCHPTQESAETELRSLVSKGHCRAPVSCSSNSL